MPRKKVPALGVVDNVKSHEFWNYMK